MLRILIFLVIVFFLGLGFAWIADNPGLVTVTLPKQGEEVTGKELTISLMVAVVAFVAIIATIMILWSIIMTIWRSPEIFSRWRRGRRKDRGYVALSRGMIAAAAGDAASARKQTRESGKLLENEPMIDLLDAQTALLEGKREVAQARFEAMLEEPETRLLGLRGLHVEAERQGEGEAAAHYAEKAMDLAPEAPWAGTALLRHQSQGGDWQGALKTLESSRWNNRLDKKQNNRLKAVLQTAEAMSLEGSSPEQARDLALAAHKLEPSLIPAAVIAARVSSRLGDIRKATRVLEATWKLEPHPEIAEAYIHVRPGDSAVDRLKRAGALASIRANHVEGRFAIAEAAIDAMDWKAAREALASILRSDPTERACLLMADIEEAEHGDRGRMRDWLSRAVRAPRDPAWTADGYVSEHWAPVSPISGKLDAFEWKVPVEQLEAPQDNMDYSELANEPLPEEAKEVDTPTIAAAATSVVSADEAGPEKSGDDAPATKEASTIEVKVAAEDNTDDTDNKTGEMEAGYGANPIVEDEAKPDDSAADTTEDSSSGDDTSMAEVTTTKPPVPDDPGVPDEEPQSRGFKLF